MSEEVVRGVIQYRVDFMRHGLEDWIIFDTRRDAEAFIEWGQENGSAFIRAVVTEVVA